MSTAIKIPSSTNRWRRDLPACLVGGACATVVISIAVSQILLALAFTNGSGRARHSGIVPTRWLMPLLGFALWTVLSLAFSDAPLAGLSQIKKLVLLAVIPITYTAFTRASQIDWTVRATLLAAFTRGAWLGTLVGFSYLVYSYRKWLVPLIPAGLLILYLAAPDALQKREQSIVAPESDSSIQSRLVMARTGLAMIADHPLFGVGPERVAPMFEQYRPVGITLPPAWYGHLHNSFMHFAAERGLPALAFFVWLIVVILRANYRLTSASNAATAALAHTAVAATLGMIVLGAFEYNFGDSEVLMLYLFFATLPLAASRLELIDIKTEPRP